MCKYHVKGLSCANANVAKPAPELQHAKADTCNFHCNCLQIRKYSAQKPNEGNLGQKALFRSWSNISVEDITNMLQRWYVHVGMSNVGMLKVRLRIVYHLLPGKIPSVDV